jgi:hypothetical protein
MEEKKDIEIKLSEALTNWSKWLITINFSTATGCIIKFNNLG